MNAAENHSEINAAHHRDRAAQHQWLVVLGLGILSLVLGAIGFLHGKGPDGLSMGIVDAFYNSMRLFHMHFDQAPYPLPWELQIARFLAPIVLWTTLFKGFIMVARSHGHGLKHLFQSRFVVICGLGQKGLQLALQCQKNHEWVIVIEKNPNNELLSICDDNGIYCLIGDATELTVLKQARVVHAKEIIIVTPEDETNLRIAIHVRNLELHDKSACLKCFVHLENIHLRERLQQVFKNENGTRGCCDLNFFDIYDGEARRVLLQLPLDGAGIAKDDPRSVHVVIFGFGRMGRSLALRAAKMGHFSNGKKLRISVIDRTADRQREHFLFHYPVLENDTICDLKFHQIDAQSFTARRLVEGWASEKNTLLHFFVCLDDNASAVEVGLRLQETLANRTDCNLWVRVKTSASLSKILETPPRIGPQIRAFGMLENNCCDQAFRHELNGPVAHALHIGYLNDMEKRRAVGETIPKRLAEVPWEDLGEEFKESNRQAADQIPIKVRALGYHIGDLKTESNPIRALTREQKRILAPMEHARWCAERWLAGWSHNEKRDDEHHLHPDLVPWQNLPDAERRIDHAQIEQFANALAANGQGIFK
jgi:voltage-gated potassium channel Kch